MAGEIPDNDDLTDLFAKDKNPDDVQSGNQQFDDATTNYTKDDPIIPLSLDTGPRVIAPDSLAMVDFPSQLIALDHVARYLPQLDQTTKIRGEDLIGDRLLSLKVKDGNFEMLDPRDKHNT